MICKAALNTLRKVQSLCSPMVLSFLEQQLMDLDIVMVSIKSTLKKDKNILTFCLNVSLALLLFHSFSLFS